jgi:LCP family protein required for cell wall assembly
MQRRTSDGYDERTRSVARLKVVSALGAGVLAAIIGFIGLTYWFAARSHPGQSPQQLIARYFIPPPERLFGKDRLAVLILGIDYNYDDRDQPFSKGARSDTIMAVSLDFPSKSVRELSVPRDMDVVLPNGHEDKINAAYAEGGPAEAEAVVAKFLGIPGFDRYVVLRINAARDLVDALGGIDVNVENSDALKHQGPNGPIDYDDDWGHLHVHLKPGWQHLNGEQAIGYARFRHDWCSDPCRIMRQQQVARAIVSKLEHDHLNTLTHIQSLLAVMRKDIETDFTPQEELSLATEFSNVDLASIKTEQVPYIGDKDLPLAGNVIIPDERAKAQLVAKLFGPEASPATAPPEALAAIAPGSVHVTVENGSGERGLASKVAQALQARGFIIDAVRNADSFDYSTTEIHARPDRPYVGDKVRSELGFPGAELKIDTATLTTTPSDVTVIIGRDYPAHKTLP